MRTIFANTALLFGLVFLPTLACAQDSGEWLVRARAVNLAPANSDGTGQGLSIDKKWLPELDVSYFLSRNEALELILTSPQKHTLNSSANGGDLGTFKQLPLTLLGQYHFDGLSGGVRPYLGLGLNYTLFSSVDLAGAGFGIKRHSYGIAAQVGVDVPVGDKWLVNIDVKKLQIATQVDLGGTDLGKFRIDPVLFGIGVGRRF